MALPNMVWSQTVRATEPNAGKVNSPYNRYGIGTLYDNKSAAIKAVGSAATAYTSTDVINAYNPATYTYLRATTFEFGIEGQSNNVNMNEKTNRSGSFTLNHINLAVPIVKSKLAINFNFSPISNSYYLSGDTGTVAGLGKVENLYKGSGNLQVASVGLSGRLKQVSLGVNAGYIFGNSKQGTYLNYADDSLVGGRNTEVVMSENYGGLFLKVGGLYKIDLKNKQYFTIGATANFGQSLKVNRNEYMMAGTGTTTSPIGALTDTIYSRFDEKGTLQMPLEYSFGLNYGKTNSFNLLADVQYTDWSKFQKFNGREGVADNAYRASIGAEILPSMKAKNSEYFSYVTYRIGAYYGKDYFNLKGQDINYFGATLGVNLPLRRFYNQLGGVNLSLDVGKRGTLSDGLASETYTKFTVGFNISDLWFQKQKYD